MAPAAYCIPVLPWLREPVRERLCSAGGVEVPDTERPPPDLPRGTRGVFSIRVSMRDLPWSGVCLRDIAPGWNASEAVGRALAAAIDETGAAFRTWQEDGVPGLRALYLPERVAEVVESCVFSTLDALMRDGR
jgi:hypothetical protein